MLTECSVSINNNGGDLVCLRELRSPCDGKELRRVEILVRIQQRSVFTDIKVVGSESFEFTHYPRWARLCKAQS